MSYKDPTYVIFDGDNDKWAYAYMKGWKANDKVDFDFEDAHDLTPMTGRAQDENYVKGELRKRMNKAAAVIVLVGDGTKTLYRYVRWEIELAQALDLPFIAVNLNGQRQLDSTNCPPILRGHSAVHVDFKMKIIKKALDEWPAQYRGLNAADRAIGAYLYNSATYEALGL